VPTKLPLIISPVPGRSCAIALVALVAGWVLSTVAAESAGSGAKVDFDRDIRPILSENCYKCHGPDDGSRKAKLRFDVRAEALKPAKSGQIPIVPGAPEKSELVARITASDPDDRMPPAASGKHLTAGQIESFRRWIAEGAVYATHWAYVKPSRPALPEVKHRKWARNPVDRFILARLEREGLKPSPPASRYLLARRVALDLTGLPPSLEEVDRFVKDRSPRAYEALVERLLNSEAFGEHWARLWLDLARYADSAGYADDPPRIIWAYRDYVIKSFNANKPFDRFTLEQIAGDLLDEPTDEERVATAFHRNTMTNNEGGTDDEEFRNAAVVDRVNTTMAVWMATSMGCAQCHNHKYDPISQAEYFRLFAILNNTADADRKDEAPVLELYTEKQKLERKRLQAELDDLAATHPSGSAVDAPGADTNLTNRAAAVKKQLAAIKPVTVPIMRELSGDKRRRTHIEFRGNYLALGDEVSEGLPAAFQPLPPGTATNRLALARWLVDPNNPLTARVLANRLWEQIFGVGIVRTSEDFGSQGDRPTHPQLLDWLACELRDGSAAAGSSVSHAPWDLKAFLKLLVTSAAYCQSSRITPALEERDPDNLLLARGPRFRMTAEVVRDQALFASGLLSRKMYGPSVRPPQPALGLSAAFGSSLDWKTSEGEDAHRRALYVEWRRTSPYPSMATFDAPSREVCTLRRPRSNTPLQALVTLNDPVYLEAAQALGRRMAETAGFDSKKAAYGFRLCVARPPARDELNRLVKLYESARAGFAKTPEEARLMAGEGKQGTENAEGRMENGEQRTGDRGQGTEDREQRSEGRGQNQKNSGKDAVELAAWTTVGNVLLNLDETLMKP
jgi:hypothetical protein